LIPDQFHLLLRTDSIPLSKVMHRLMTGYAVTFNKRHRRLGYLFESRYNSISYENGGCLLDLIRYIHLIPFQAKVVRDIDDLDKYPWSGLSGILDYSRNPLIPEIRGQAPRDRQTASKRT